MLSKIDKLFACNVGHHIDLPQIVVVGDQSSGKSSVLEGLTRLPFPRDSGLCTRFATQITFRRSQAACVSVSIIPGKDATQDHADAARAWKKADLAALDLSAFTSIMQEVQGVMGIDKKKTFSSDVLSIEVTGPDQEHLTVIDVPGIFQRVTKDVTTKEDKEFVKSMVFDYMKNPRSVMLTVIPANVDVATQLILEMAEEVDKEGQRTLGVLTKPDLVDKGAEKAVADMVEGRTHQLNLGWCIVKNPGQQDIGNLDFDRYAEEDVFFKTVEPWKGLPMDRLGVEALRERLQLILAAHIRREFPKVKLEVNSKLKEVKKALEFMGQKRDTPAEQSQFLIDIATRFQVIATEALDGKYVNDCFSQFPILKLATQVVNREDEFSKDFALFGHTYHFSSNDNDEEEGVAQKPVNPFENIGPHANAPTQSPQPQGKVPAFGSTQPLGSTFQFTRPQVKSPVSSSQAQPECSSRKRPFSATGLSDILHDNTKLPCPKGSEILKWLSETFVESRGFELGNFSPALLGTTMKAQSTKWDDLAFGFISDIVYITDCFIIKLLSLVCPDNRTFDRLKEMLLDELQVRYKRAFEQVRFILQVERFCTPGTLNHYFNDNLEKCRQKRLRKLAESKSRSNESGIAFVRVDDLVQTSTAMSNKDHAVQDLHDILKAYYKVARKRIVDNIVSQGGRYWLIIGPDTPLKLFNPTFVSQMSMEQLQEVAGEDALTRRRRAQLLREHDDLEKGRKILS
ncbi:Interferon-induced GTP-binding protein Mx2 [Lasiodiplodia theobromae]|uniref:Interferon-induced GTP-binding protein Mx2 n=1 Tax=Lasiodiplodia theobromae TaxID=45133 RepID=A0A5N5CUZ1_9PEZI|nr:Interferon-induced GTP-binding protein Mx2 [Lasiodiplodia theobromae]